MNGQFFVGRTRELALLDGMLARVAAGVGGAVLVEGEQGIGKTALLRRAMGGAADAGVELAWGAADELGQRFPLWLMTECLGAQGRLVPIGSGRRGEASARRRGTGGRPSVSTLPVSGQDPAAAVERLLARVDGWCASSPVVLVAEDLQWADEASLRLWQRLARTLGQMPLLLVGSLRPGPMSDELNRLRRGLVSLGGPVISLGPLAPRELSELAAGLAGGLGWRQLEGVARRSGGNPLYARELLKSLTRDVRARLTAGEAEPGAVDVPASLAGTIRGRLGVLSQEAAKVLPWAAVLGPEFAVTDLAVVTGRTAGQLIEVVDEAMTAGMIGEAASPPAGEGGVAGGAGPRLAFRHDLIRQVLYGDMPWALRVALHLQAARALASAGAVPERVAAQLAMVPESLDSWALEWLADAAPALSFRAPKVAAQLLPGPLSRLLDADERREALEVALVTSASLLARDAEVERAGGRLLAAARDPDLATEVAWRVGYTLMRTGRVREALNAVTKAKRRAGTSAVWTARLHALGALTVSAAGRPGCANAARKALALAEEADDRFAAGYALYALCLGSFRKAQHAAALDHVEQVLEVIGHDPQTTDLRLLALCARAHALERLGRQSEAGTAIKESLALARCTGTPQLATACYTAAEYYFAVGQWNDALDLLAQVEAEAPAGPCHDRVRAHALLALITGHRDDWGAAAQHLAAATEAAGRAEVGVVVRLHPAHQHFLLLAQAEAADHGGSPIQAAAVLSACLGPLSSRGATDRSLLFPVLCRMALQTGDAATAMAAATAAAREAGREPTPVKTAAAEVCRGLLAGDAAALLTSAASYESAGRPLECAQALEDAAVLLAGQRDFGPARQAFGDAIGLYRGLAAHGDVRRVTTRLRDYGIRLAGRGRRLTQPSTGWHALTPTETKIAYLIARGQSNPGIAAELWLSRNTVQTHVSHILAKLGARSRVEIAREALLHPRPGNQAAGRLTA